MSLNLRIGRPRPRSKSRGQLLWLLIVILIAIAILAWQNGWQPEDTVAMVNRQVMPYVSETISQSLPQPVQASLAPQSQVVMVSSKVIENPHSDAYIADLYAFSGKDDIPWPNINGRTSVELYVVQSGDSLWGIAGQFGLDLDSLRWSNPALERNPDVLSVGEELKILPVQGVLHVVEVGETLPDIAVRYGVAPEDISQYPPNALFPAHDLEVGQDLIVPFGRKDLVALPQPELSPLSELAWPLVGHISGGYGPDHEALDIGAPYGATVYAAADGTIVYADWAYEGYGYTVIMDHGQGRQTWYNHLKGARLEKGNFVTRGTAIGEVGSTGHSTGPHVHFEVRIDGKRVNPWPYLPGDTPQ